MSKDIISKAESELINAINGSNWDPSILEELAFTTLDKQQSAAILDLLLTLANSAPAKAAGISSLALNAIIAPLDLQTMLDKIGFPECLQIEQFQPVILDIISRKITPQDYCSKLDQCFNLLLNCDTATADCLETLAHKVPQQAANAAPLAELLNGDEIQLSRGLDLMIILLSEHATVPTHLISIKFQKSDSEIATYMKLQYLNSLIRVATNSETEIAVSEATRNMLLTLPESSYQGLKTKILSSLAHFIPALFEELDTEFQIVVVDKRLVATIPPNYVIAKHSDLLPQLTIHDFEAVVNLCSNFEAFKFFNFPEGQILNLVNLKQLVFCASASSTTEGCLMLHNKYPKVLINVLSLPKTEEIRDLRLKLETNLKFAGVPVHSVPDVAVVSA